MDPFTPLDRDRNNLAARPPARRVMTAWAERIPSLASYDSPAGVVADIGRMGDPDRSCRLLAHLLVLAGDDALAARAVLQALTPGLRRAASRRWRTAAGKGPWPSYDDIAADTITAAWEAIHARAGERYEYPARVIVRFAEGRLASRTLGPAPSGLTTPGGDGRPASGLGRDRDRRAPEGVRQRRAVPDRRRRHGVPRSEPVGTRSRRPVDFTSEAHDIVLNIFGTMSRGERTRLKKWVRAGMTAMAGSARFLGGRPPFGYQLVPTGVAHPNPDKARWGIQLQKLEPHPQHAKTVEQIFAWRLERVGYRTIAARLDAAGIPSPSAADPARNQHRLQAGWSVGAPKRSAPTRATWAPRPGAECRKPKSSSTPPTPHRPHHPPAPGQQRRHRLGTRSHTGDRLARSLGPGPGGRPYQRPPPHAVQTAQAHLHPRRTHRLRALRAAPVWRNPQEPWRSRDFPLRVQAQRSISRPERASRQSHHRRERHRPPPRGMGRRRTVTQPSRPASRTTRGGHASRAISSSSR